jgi:hypothetical protein
VAVMIFWDHEQVRTATEKKFDENELKNTITDRKKVYSTLSG